ncbi:HK97 gp10 family phage protein [Nocardia sp. CC201C]|uniref:HK97 gp10 family phage protein n=1 Tax=Nocardia sp. CC201C TaxID=3044575 RepID=UPI0024A9E814|nr:HK97 gp10 family phage protein [Nocardia sp. CC201C]
MTGSRVHRARIASVMATAAGQWGDRVGREIANRARANCPVDEGRLRSSITHLVTALPGGGVSVRVGSPLAYARYRHEGTGLYGPHQQRIYPVTAKALKFRKPRLVGPLPRGVRQLPTHRRPFVFAKSVRGIVGSPYLTSALEEVFGAAAITRHPTS